MIVKVNAMIAMEYELREDQTLEELIEEVVDQIWSGEYFPSRVKDVDILMIEKSA